MEIVWNNDVKPPEGTQRAKDGKMGWYLEKDGTRHTLDRCRKEDTVSPQVNEYEFVVPQAETTPEITAAVKTVKSVTNKIKIGRPIVGNSKSQQINIQSPIFFYGKSIWNKIWTNHSSKIRVSGCFFGIGLTCDWTARTRTNYGFKV